MDEELQMQRNITQNTDSSSNENTQTLSNVDRRTMEEYARLNSSINNMILAQVNELTTLIQQMSEENSIAQNAMSY